VGKRLVLIDRFHDLFENMLQIVYKFIMHP